MAVSVLAMLFDIMPVMVTAIFSALLWNFFFIPPLYKFAIGTPEDVLLFLMYFVIALLNAVLTSKLRKAELDSREKEEREKTIQLYNTLLNSLSHELRTPISTIIGSVDTLKSNYRKLSLANREDLLNEINIAGMRLNRHVDNLLNMSRLESGIIKPELDWCDLNELAHKVLNNLEDDMSEHTVVFSSNESLPLFKLDRGLMEQVFNNILHNAIQYTPKGSSIEIILQYINNQCQIKFIDNGPGFPKDNLLQVFQKFFRVPESKTGGLGLGLSIVKGIIEAHNGTIILQNNDIGSGAIFTITIPSEIAGFNKFENE